MILMLTEETGVPPMDFIVELAKRYPTKPLYVTFTGQKQYMDAGKAFLEPRGVPTFPLIEEPFEVLSITVRSITTWCPSCGPQPSSISAGWAYLPT